MNRIKKNKVLLVIMDGWGLSSSAKGNAPLLAKTPVLDSIYATFPKISISASGLGVGLNKEEVGNSEVGHLNIGTGRVAWESLPRIDTEIENGKFAKNPVLMDAMNKSKYARLHLIGLVSDGGVHSSVEHLKELIKIAKKFGVSELYIHFISDGRDTAVRNAAGFADDINKTIDKLQLGKIATLIGRYYAMDRDKRWERTETAYHLYAEGQGAKFTNIDQAIKENYKAGLSDEFIKPAIIDQEGIIRENDVVVFYNFRADRMRQLVETFVTNNCQNLTLKDNQGIHIFTMTEYKKDFTLPIVYQPIIYKNTLADVLYKQQKIQYHIAESEKYAHVTYFFNGSKEEVHKNEHRVLVKSSRVATYDLLPQMSADEVSEKVIAAINEQANFIVVNYANGDMVGHSGNLDATIQACEAVDRNLSQIISAAKQFGYHLILTADHGNCEKMIQDESSQPCTEHTNNPVPLVYLNLYQKSFDRSHSVKYSKQDYLQYASQDPEGKLADVASTILQLMKLKQPVEIEGESLLNKLIIKKKKNSVAGGKNKKPWYGFIADKFRGNSQTVEK